PPLIAAKTKPSEMADWRRRVGTNRGTGGDLPRGVSQVLSNGGENDGEWLQVVASAGLPGPVQSNYEVAAPLGATSAVAVALKVLMFLAQVSPGSAEGAHRCGVRTDRSLLEEMKGSLVRRVDLASAKAREKGLDPASTHTSVNYIIPMGIGGTVIRK